MQGQLHHSNTSDECAVFSYPISIFKMMSQGGRDTTNCCVVIFLPRCEAISPIQLFRLPLESIPATSRVSESLM